MRTLRARCGHAVELGLCRGDHTAARVRTRWPCGSTPPGGDQARLLVLTGRILGWRRATDGRWIGLVDYEICDQQGRAAVFHVRAAVAADALSPISPTPRR